ncbi:hypothetical protein [Lentzea sp. E54]|uniref:hypothetical protein n=1 Tax=Lentzea xerophila TaxID=3435883 RepID=UPI003DA6258A
MTPNLYFGVIIRHNRENSWFRVRGIVAYAPPAAALTLASRRRLAPSNGAAGAPHPFARPGGDR